MAPSNRPTPSNLRPAAQAAATVPRAGRGGWLLTLLMLALVGAAWLVSHLEWIDPRSDIRGQMGVFGAGSIALSMIYSLRKRLPMASSWGGARYWLAAHILLTVAGGALILLHIDFNVRTLHGSLAAYALAAVLCSGLLGRFLYVRTHIGPRGDRATLPRIQKAVSVLREAADAQLASVPAIAENLRLFERDRLAAPPLEHGHLWRFFILPFHRRKLLRLSVATIKESVRWNARQQNWPRQQAAKQMRRQRAVAQHYALAVQRAVQFQTFDRLFSIWQVLHIVLAVAMLGSLVYHVLALRV